MRRTRFVILGVMLVAIFGFSIGVMGENTRDEAMCVPMGKLLLEPPGSVQPKKSPVEFPHSRHFSLECRVCHHEWTGDSHIQSCTTSGCHDLAQLPEKSDKGKKDDTLTTRYYKNAFHTLCIGCHKKINIDNQEKEFSFRVLKTKLPSSGPTGCVHCHPKQE